MAYNDIKFGLALGGGGARGLVHIHVLEVLDELGIKPEIIAGTSIGAIFGVAYAAGLSGLEIREFALDAMGKRINIIKKLFGHKPETLVQLWNFKQLSRSLLKPEILLEHVFPENVKVDFDQLKIPTKIITTDYYRQSQVVLDNGPVLNAVAASMALPAVFRPVTLDDMILVDGGLTNPLPFDTISNDVDQILAIDVTGGPFWQGQEKLPAMSEVLFAAAQIPQNTIVREKLKQHQPTIFLRAPVDNFPALGFHKIKHILKETKSFRDVVKKQIDEKFEKETILLGSSTAG